MKYSFLLLALALLTNTLCAQEERDESEREMNNDRPIIIRTHTVEGDKNQLELLLRISRDKDGSPIELRAPYLYRRDIGKGLEFRVQSNFLTYQKPTLGFSDTSLGVKWNFADDGKSSWAVVGMLELPTGSGGFEDTGPEPSVTFVYGHRFNKKWDLAINAGSTLNRDSDTQTYYTSVNAAAQVSYHFNPRTELNTALLVQSPDALTGGITRLSGALGVTHSLNEHQRINFTIGRSFSTTGDDYQFITGWSTRF